MKQAPRAAALLALAALAVSACASASYRYREPAYEGPIRRGTVLRSIQIDAALAEKILALDPENVAGRDVREVLARGPAPRIINLHGGVPLVYLAMRSLSEFLIGMGYPGEKIRNPRDGTYSYSPYKSSEEIAGLIAWYYEREGMPPLLIGHSMGGIQAVKVLHELAGTFTDRIAVWNPLTEEAEDRYAIVDPLTGRERSVVGVRVGYAAAAGAGGIARLLQWRMLGRLRTIPDAVEHFTGFSIGLDFIGGDFLGLAVLANEYAGTGAGKVRNVRLPAGYNHVTFPTTSHLAESPAVREWIDAYVPGKAGEPPADGEARVDNILFAADLWYSVKKQWCLEAQRLVRAKRAMEADRSMAAPAWPRGLPAGQDTGRAAAREGGAGDAALGAPPHEGGRGAAGR